MTLGLLLHDRHIRAVIGLDLAALVAQRTGGLDVNQALSNVTLAGTTLATLYVVVSKMIDGRRLTRDRERWQADMERRRQEDDYRREQEAKDAKSLNVQLKESLVNQEKMRATLHDLATKAQRKESESDELRAELRTMADQLAATAEELHRSDLKLHEANVRIAELSNRVASQQQQTPGIVRDAAAEGAEKGAARAIAAAIPDSKVDFPVAAPEETR